MSQYSHTIQSSENFESTVQKVKNILAEQGFGILTEIDVQATMKKKIDAEMSSYVILGVCNPKLAYQALQAEPSIGLFLPCKVIVYEKENQVLVSFMLPSIVMNLVDNGVVKNVAQQAEELLLKAFDKIS